MRFFFSHAHRNTRIFLASILVLFISIQTAVASSVTPYSGTTPTTVSAPVVAPTSVPAATATTSSQQLQKDLDKKRKRIDDLDKQIKTYQKVIQEKQGTAATLENQLAIIRDRIAKAELDLEVTNDRIDENALSIKQLRQTILETNNRINSERLALEQLLQHYNNQESQSFIVVLLKEDRLSNFVDELVGNQYVQQEVERSMSRLDVLLQRQRLEQAALDQKQKELTTLQKKLSDAQTALTEQQDAKEALVVETRMSESKYQGLLDQARQEQYAADQEIRNLERSIRDQLARESKGRYNPNVNVSLVWPVPNQGISASFHDPSYVFRKVFEHPAIDIRTLKNGVSTNGLPVRAAASGYVAKARDAGLGYSYILIIHNNRISTVYGHVSRIDVKQDSYVTQGQVIGLSGGRPGTPGAGNLTTGPHLHFEVRVDGIPVNPINYLP